MSTDLKMGQQIRSAMIQADLDDDDVAEATGRSPGTVRNWRYDQGRPRHDELLTLAKLTGKSIDYFYGRPDATLQDEMRSLQARLEQTFDGDKVPSEDMTNVPLVGRLTGPIDRGELIAVPTIAIPNGIAVEHVVAVPISDGALSPAVNPGDIAIVVHHAAEIAPVDGDLIVVPDDDGSTPLIRRAVMIGDDELLATGSDPTDRRRCAVRDVWGIVAWIMRDTWQH